MSEEADLVRLLPPGQTVGSIRTRKPSVYIFSGGNEDAAFFSVNGFSVLIDGGDKRDVPYWNLIRNYDKISAAIITRISANCLRGIAAILMRKCLEECHPNFGAVICNLPPANVAGGDSEASKLLRAMYDGLRAEQLKPIEAFAGPKIEPITLYEVIGEGALRMIVLNPERGSKEITALANAFKTGEGIEKHAAATSLALLLVWHPADHSKPVTRILVTGACPLEKLYATLEKLKGEEYLRHPEYVVANSKERPHTAAGTGVRVSLSAGQMANKAKKPVAPAAATIAAAAGGSRPTAARPGTVHGQKLQAAETPIKKAVSQPAHGAAVSRVGGALRKVPQPPKLPTAASRIAGDTRGTHERPGQGARAKVMDKGKMKHGDSDSKSGKCKDSDNVSSAATGSSPSEISKTSPSVSGPSGPQSPQAAKGQKASEGQFGGSESEADRPLKEHTAQPQPLNEHGLLGEVEEPMKLRKMSMDLENSNKGANEDGARDNSTNSPLSPSAPHPLDHLSAQHTDRSAAAVGGVSDDRAMDEKERLEMQHKKSMQELLGAGACPFTTGLVSSIVDDATEIAQLAAQEGLLKGDRDADDVAQLSALDQSIDRKDDSAVKKEEEEKSKLKVVRETYEVRSDVSSDSVNAAPDPALDEVINSLADASEEIDKGVRSPEGDEFGKKLMGNAVGDSLTHATAAKNEWEVDPLTGATRDVNDNANLLTAQHAYEDVNSREMYLPPMSSGVRARAKQPLLNGAKAKPKLSQPLYFDIVFVPHHGLHPSLKDEESARAFVSSIRSRRYILSGQDAIRTHFIDGLIAGKLSWNKPELEVDVLPTHDSDELIVYSHQNTNEMAEAGVNLRCSVERCTLRLSSGASDDVCAAFKFEM